MGSVRKLAMIVVIGLMAVSTAITVYIANEPNRRGNETGEQQDVAIERGTSLYITYCLQCHGPAGLGSMEGPVDGNTRPGAPLNQSLIPEDRHGELKAVFQSEDPVLQGQAEDFIRFRIMYGAPGEAQLYQNAPAAISMPAFRHDLNVEQINDLVYLITHGDWNYVYNTTVHKTGQSVCQTAKDNGETLPEMCTGDFHDAVAYPTVVPPAAPAGETAATPQADSGNTGSGADHAVKSTDNAFDTNAITVKPGDTISLTNDGFAQHDLVVTDLGIGTELVNNGESQTITIPADAKPGDYEFHCSVAGHKESGMTGTITVEAP